LTGTPKKVSDPDNKSCNVFVSYSHKDIAVAARVHVVLERAGHKVWRDERKIEPGANWNREIARALARSDTVVLLWSPAAASSRSVEHEWLTARALGKGIVPCMLRRHRELKPDQQLPGELGDVQTIPFDARSFRAGIRKLVKLLERPDSVFHAWGYSRVPPHSFIRFPPNPDFVGRQPELLELYLLLIGELNPVGINQSVGASGPGGIGKTQLAAEFAWRFAHAFPDGIIWINAARNWRDEFLAAARCYGLTVENPSSNDADQRLLNRFQGYLTEHNRVLIVLDNVADPTEIDGESRLGFRLTTIGCRLLFTSRSRALPLGAKHVSVDALSESESLELLTHGNEPGEDDEEAAQEICRRLGHLPLAIEMAGSFLRENKGSVSFQEYLANLTSCTGVIEKFTGTRLPATHDPSLIAAFQEQYAAVRNPDAKLIFKIAGQLSEAEVIPVARLSLLSGIQDPARGLVRPMSKALQELVRVSCGKRIDGSQREPAPLAPGVRRQSPI